jgi:hypothetical protein
MVSITKSLKILEHAYTTWVISHVIFLEKYMRVRYQGFESLIAPIPHSYLWLNSPCSWCVLLLYIFYEIFVLLILNEINLNLKVFTTTQIISRDTGLRLTEAGNDLGATSVNHCQGPRPSACLRWRLTEVATVRRPPRLILH